MHEWTRAPRTPQGHTARWVLSGYPRSGWVYRLEPGLFLAVATERIGKRHVDRMNGGKPLFFTKLKLAKFAIERWVDGKPIAAFDARR